MKLIKQTLPKALMLFVILTLLCGLIYPSVVTAAAQLIFPDKANGSLIEINGRLYGSELLGQRFEGKRYLWGRVMELDLKTFKDEDGNPLMYAGPSNLSPASDRYAELIAERVKKLREAHPEHELEAVPVDLVTCSGSGLDPHISPAAAEFQVERIARERGMNEDKVREVIRSCTTGRFLGIFGEPCVNVLEVNLKLDGILKQKGGK